MAAWLGRRRIMGLTSWKCSHCSSADMHLLVYIVCTNWNFTVFSALILHNNCTGNCEYLYSSTKVNACANCSVRSPLVAGVGGAMELWSKVCCWRHLASTEAKGLTLYPPKMHIMCHEYVQAISDQGYAQQRPEQTCASSTLACPAPPPQTIHVRIKNLPFQSVK